MDGRELGATTKLRTIPSEFVERVWKSVKYEEVYLKAYANVPEARASIGKYLDFYNGRRPHQSLARQTPDQAFINALQSIPAAA
jgi:putative transposase